MSLAGRDYVGSYRLIRVILAGRTCTVWEASDDEEKERYALKILQGEHRKDKEQVAMLKQEYTVGQSMDHPNVLKIYKHGIDQHTHYVVMELCDPRNLKQDIRDGVEKLVPKIDAAIEGAARGLEYFHSKGWVHRDIKPDNLIMGEDNVVKLIDFAIAQKIRKGFGKLFGGKSKVQGTMSYMSPEQIRGQTLDQRADIYSFGCTVFEMLCGKVPYTGESANELLNKHLKASVPSVLSVNENVTAEMAKLLAKTMAKDPEQRPTTMSAFLDEFKRVRVFRSRNRSGVLNRR